MKKRIFSALMLLVLTLSLTACSGVSLGGYRPSKEWKEIYKAAVALEKEGGDFYEEIAALADKAILCDPAAAEGYLLAAKYAVDDLDAYMYLLLGQQHAADKDKVEAALTEFRANKTVITPQEVLSYCYSNRGSSGDVAYDKEGRVVAVSYSGGEVAMDIDCTWTYDAQGRIGQCCLFGAAYIFSYSYDENGLLIGSTEETGVDFTEHVYEPQTGRLMQSIKYEKGAGSQPIQSSTYVYEEDTIICTNTEHTQSGEEVVREAYSYMRSRQYAFYISAHDLTATGDRYVTASENFELEVEMWFTNPFVPFGKCELLTTEHEYYHEDGTHWKKSEYTWWLPEDNADVWFPEYESEKEYLWLNNGWALKEEVFYDTSGRETLKSEYSYDYNGELAVTIVLENDYDGSLRGQKYSCTTTEGVTTTSISSYSYNDDGNKSEVQYTVFAADGSVEHTLAVLYEYQPDEWWPYKESYVLDGVMVVIAEELDDGTTMFTYADGSSEPQYDFDWNYNETERDDQLILIDRIQNYFH